MTVKMGPLRVLVGPSAKEGFASVLRVSQDPTVIGPCVPRIVV